MAKDKVTPVEISATLHGRGEMTGTTLMIIDVDKFKTLLRELYQLIPEEKYNSVVALLQEKLVQSEQAQQTQTEEMEDK